METILTNNKERISLIQPKDRVFYYSKKNRVSNVNHDKNQFIVTFEDGTFIPLNCTEETIRKMYPETHKDRKEHKEMYGENVNHFVKKSLF